MMFNKISLITSLLFFLLGTNVFADSRLEVSSSQNSPVLSQTAQLITLNSVNYKLISANKKSWTKMEQASFPSKHEKVKKPSLRKYVIPVFVGLFFTLGLGSYWLVFRKKHT